MDDVVWAWEWAEQLVSLAQWNYEKGTKERGNQLMNCAIIFLDQIEAARIKWEKNKVYPSLR